MDQQEAEQYRGQIVMNTEEEVFYPTLTVGRTMDFATRLKTPETLPEKAESHEQHRRGMKEFLLDSMGISHTVDTKVGDAFVRGVSGGERKRVSILETLVSQASTAARRNLHHKNIY
jgi:ABC-type multidrug transport system ATPase subunit